MTNGQREAGQFLHRSPLLYKILKTMLESKDPISPRILSHQLNRAEPTIHLALKDLLEAGLVQKRLADDKRIHLYSIPSAKVGMARSAIAETAGTSVPLAMEELERLIRVGLEETSSEVRIVESAQWRNSVNRALLPTPDLVLFLGERGPVVIELMLGTHHFAHRAYEMAGRLLAFRDLNVDLVALCVFGQVETKLKKSFSRLVCPLFSDRSDLFILFAREEPLMILQGDDSKKVVREKVIMHLVRELNQRYRVDLVKTWHGE